jgi:hypothetical protein
LLGSAKTNRRKKSFLRRPEQSSHRSEAKCWPTGNVGPIRNQRCDKRSRSSAAKPEFGRCRGLGSNGTENRLKAAARSWRCKHRTFLRGPLPLHTFPRPARVRLTVLARRWASARTGELYLGEFKKRKFTHASSPSDVAWECPAGGRCGAYHRALFSSGVTLEYDHHFSTHLKAGTCPDEKRTDTGESARR